jgi:hypothetical protein
LNLYLILDTYGDFSHIFCFSLIIKSTLIFIHENPKNSQSGIHKFEKGSKLYFHQF